MDSEILILTEEEFQKYIQSQKEVGTSKSIPSSPSNNYIPSQKLEPDSKAAENMLREESKHHFLKILDSLDLSLAPDGSKAKINPIRIPDHRFLNLNHQNTVMSRLHTKTPKHRCKTSVNNFIEIKFTSTPTSPIKSPKKKEKRKVLLKKKVNRNSVNIKNDTVEEFSGNEIKFSSPSNEASNEIQEQNAVNRRASSLQIDSNLFEFDNQKLSRISSRFPFTTRPSKKILKKYLTEVNSLIPQDSERSTNPSEGLLPSGSATTKHINLKKRKLKRENSDSTLDLGVIKDFRPNSRSPKNSDDPKMLEKKKYHKILNEIRKSYKKEEEPNKNSLGELMQIMFKTRPIIEENISPKEAAQYKALNEKLYNMIRENPSELYRILNNPDYFKDSLSRKDFHLGNEWTEEQESAFKSMIRKTHSFNSLVKTRLFKEAEKDLPPTRTTQDIEWKYDRHSPWVNDLDYNNDNYFQINQEKNNTKKSSISNLKKITKEREELDPSQEEIRRLKELQEKTGISSSNLLALQNQAKYIDKIQDFDQAINGCKMIKKWKRNKSDYEAAKVKFADHIIGNCQIDMKQLNKARYSYLSAKVAHQRASSELSDKFMLEAEEKRKELRQRQENFQRDVTIYRNICKERYGRTMKFGQRRILETTAHPLGSPRFKSFMVKLGYLPRSYSPQPRPIKDFDPNTIKKVNINVPKESLNQLSLWNFPSSPSEKNKKSSLKSALKIQAYVKGYFLRKKVRTWKKAAVKIQKAFKWFRAKKFVLTALVVEQIATGNLLLGSLLIRYKDTLLYKQILKDIIASKFIQNMLMKRKEERVKYEDFNIKSLSRQSSIIPVKSNRSSLAFTPNIKSNTYLTFSEKAIENLQRNTKRNPSEIPVQVKLEDLPENAKLYFDSIK